MRDKIAIIGVGLIGGSLGLALRRRGAARLITGVDRSATVLERAREIGAIDEGTTDLAEGVRDADMVVIATPIGATLEIADDLGPMLARGVVVTDVGSAKGVVCRRLREAIPDHATFIGGHPMAGSEGQGVEAADPYLFQNAVYVLTPDSDTPPDVLAGLREIIALTGAQIVTMPPDLHDRLVAAVSHLPQLVAVALVNTVAAAAEETPEVLSMAAGGFRDTTRITASPPEIWLDILTANREAVLEMLRRFRTTLTEIEREVEEGDHEGLRRGLLDARRIREQLPRRPKGLLPAYFELVVTVQDRPGVIGGLAGLLGERGINIQDIEILRLREGEGGTIRLGFATEGECGEAFSFLKANGYKVQRR